MGKQDFLEWLKDNKISTNGKYKNKRWGSISIKDNSQWTIRICVQYDEYLKEFFADKPLLANKVINSRNDYNGCGRCFDGKCAFTGFDINNPTEEELDIAKTMIMYRIAAIKQEHVPNCSYIKISERNKEIQPCAIHKVCNPKCKAMKKY